MNKKDKKRGFTYAELLGVIAILGIITLISLPIISKIQEDNRLTQYETYAESLKNAGKLYTDSYSKDMFGYHENGCYDIKYSELKEKNLIKDIKINEITCGKDDSTTFVRVIKSKDNYKYETAIVCKNKKDEPVYEKSLISATCEGKEDKTGPKISLSPTNMDWTRGLNKKVTVTIYDFYGLLENQKVRYAWTTTPTSINESEYTTISFENKRGVNEAKLEIPLPTDKTGYYYLVIQPIDVRDINGNYQTNPIQSEIFKLDNTKPTCGTNNGSTEWTNEAKTITVNCTDGESGCTKNSFSEKFTSDSKTSKITIKDNVGNKEECSVDVYIDTKPPTTAYVNKDTLRCTGCESVTYKCDRETYSQKFNNCTITIKYTPGASDMVTYYGFIRTDNLSGAKPYSDEYKWYSDGKNAKNQTTWTTQAPTSSTRDCGQNYTKCYIDLRYYDNAGNVSNTLRTYFVNK